MRIFFSIILFSPLLLSENFSNSLTSQGFTGLINTPNAQVIKEGDAVFHYSNQKDNHLRYYDYDAPMAEQENFLAGIGFLSSVELTGKLVENVGRARDLSGNIKYKIPFNQEYLPNIAIGWQDLGSAANFYGNRYIVLDKEFSFLRASFGYGDSTNDLGDRRMNGLFGGIEAQVADWNSIMAEYDGEESHLAFRIRTPRSWFSSIRVEGMIAQNLTESETSFSVNVNIPLFHDSKQNIYLDDFKNGDNDNISISRRDKKIKKNFTTEKSSFQLIQDKLVSIGFENIQVGYYNKSIYIKTENSIFDHNDLDALGVIMGIIIQNKQDEKHYIITLLKNGLQTLTISGDINICKNYFNTPTVKSERAFRNSLHFTRTFNEADVQFITTKQKSSRFIPRLELSPSLITTVGTEVGVFDYLVGLRANAYMNLADGLVFSTSYDTPLFNSQNFDKGYIFATTYKEQLKNRFVNSMLHQTLHQDSILNTTSIGQYQSDYFGLLNHFNVTSVSGEHGFNLKIGRFKNQRKNQHDTRDLYWGSYRYFYAPLDLFTEFSYGQYWNQDKGAMLEMKRFFGETSVAFYLKDTIKTYAGFEVSIPLTFRKSHKASPFGQIKGKKDFSYGIRTVVQSPDNANYLNSTGGVIPKSDLELTSVYLNRDRLSSSYIKAHLNRIRDSFILYSEKE